MTTPPRQAAVWRSGQPLRFISTRSLVHPFAAARHFPSRGNKKWSRWTLRPLEGETRRYGWQKLWALMKRRVERSPATMELATLRSEISPLHFASVEMTGRGAAFGVICLSANDCMLPAAIVISSGAACRYE